MNDPIDPARPVARIPAAIPVIDVFAGPGGLGEGFAALTDAAARPRFELALSVERDACAHRTLELRALVRRLGGHADVREHLRGTRAAADLFDRHPAAAAAARAEAWRAELGAPDPGRAVVRDRIDAALRGRGEWVLIGGPPCQAYSIVGRSRNRGIDGYRLEDDHRSTLYVEYLQLLADHRPAVFVMENVKGLLSARRNGESMFGRIAADLRDPAGAIAREGRGGTADPPAYDLYPVTAGVAGDANGSSLSAPDHARRRPTGRRPQVRGAPCEFAPMASIGSPRDDEPAMPTQQRRNWTRDETLIAFRLYCCTPFGKLHHGNPDIVALAGRLGRTPSAVGMKACNFASLDPRQRERGITALANVSGLDKQVWSEFEANPEAVAAEAEAVYAVLPGMAAEAVTDGGAVTAPTQPGGPTETERLVRVRRVQAFFRNAVLVSYGGRCAVTGIDLPELLNASHIVPWAASVELRAAPSNGFCLNALLDRAFDRGLLTFDEDLRLVLSPRLRGRLPDDQLDADFARHAGKPLAVPTRFTPSASALAFHRQHVFR